MRHRVFILLALAASGALSIGCAGGREGTEKELAELRAEITRLRADGAALTGRVDQLEIDKGSFAKGAAADPAKATDRPDLNVVRLAPQEGNGDADADGPRPVIRAVGNDGSVKKDKDKAKPSKKSGNNADAGKSTKP